MSPLFLSRSDLHLPVDFVILYTIYKNKIIRRLLRIMYLLDGKAVSTVTRERIKEETREFIAQNGYAPGLAVVLVGDDPASRIYVRNKHRACEEMGFLSRGYTFPSDVSQEELLSLIDTLNNDDTIHGILIQLPLPERIDPDAVIRAISPEKDVDAFHPYNVGQLFLGQPGFVPCTPAGILEILRYYQIDVAGKHCVVLGRSNIVGKPILARDATVTICHSKTKNLIDITRQADILVVAVGRAGFVKKEMVKPGAVVIDVGINRNDQGHLTGDVSFEEVCEVASAVTPVPGGVGPMTITMLMKNTVDLAEIQNE